jgi:predicted Zn-dependent protease
MLRVYPALCVLALASACAVNPVTGHRELAFVSEADEIAIGEERFGPVRQMLGGDYVADPALEEYVAGVGRRIAAVSDRDLPYEFVVVNSSVPNAWTLPGGKIGVNRGLLVELGSEAELAAVLAHEIVHAAARHGALALQRGAFVGRAVLATAAVTHGGDYARWALDAAGAGAELLTQHHNRDAELEADRYGMRYMAAAGYDPVAAVQLQETFLRLFEENDDPGWLDGLLASHPPSRERLERNRRTAARLPSGGEIGRDRYAAAIAVLRAARPAYRAYDEGRAALAEQRFDDARAFASEAERLVPREAHFHALRGDVDFSQRRYEAALAEYTKAIELDDGFFYYYLRSGLARQRLGRLDAARADLERSLGLLPTADAYRWLGVLAEQRGDRLTALEHYARAALSASPAGTAARAAFLRLDLPRNPGEYLHLRTGLGRERELWIEVENPLLQPVEDVVVTVHFDAAGIERTTERRLDGPIDPGRTARLETGLGPFRSARAYRASLETAHLAEPPGQ